MEGEEEGEVEGGQGEPRPQPPHHLSGGAVVWLARLRSRQANTAHQPPHCPLATVQGESCLDRPGYRDSFLCSPPDPLLLLLLLLLLPL